MGDALPRERPVLLQAEVDERDAEQEAAERAAYDAGREDEYREMTQYYDGWGW